MVTTDLGDDTSLYIVFEADGKRETQLLDTYPDLYLRPLPMVYLDDPLQSSNGKIILSTDNPVAVHITGYYGDETDGPTRVADCRVGLFRNKKIVSYLMRQEGGQVNTNGCGIYLFAAAQREEIAVAEGDEFCFAAVMEDEFGRRFLKPGVRFVIKVGHLAPMKHLLSALDPAGQKKVMAALDKRDEELLKTVLDELNKAELYEPLISLIKAQTLDEVFKIAGDIPERARIEETFAYLKAQEIPVILNFGIARGLDYYTGMVFEGFADNLGAENQILGGGVYRLAHLFGGKDTPCCGFGIGFDRVAVSIGEFAPKKAVSVAIIAGKEERAAAYKAAAAFRAEGITAVMDLLDRSFSAQLSSAIKTGVSYAVLVGPKEAAAGTVTLKNLEKSEQKEMDLAAAVADVCSAQQN